MTTLDVEALTCLDLKPDEFLAVTVGWTNCTPAQLEEFGEYLAGWLRKHGMPVAGVLALPPGSSLAAVPPPKDSPPPRALPDSWGGLNHAEIREALESAASIKHLAGHG